VRGFFSLLIFMFWEEYCINSWNQETESLVVFFLLVIFSAHQGTYTLEAVKVGEVPRLNYTYLAAFG
jgi:hypothetical protein